MESSPRLPQLEKARAQQRRPNAAKKKNDIPCKHNIYSFIHLFIYLFIGCTGSLLRHTGFSSCGVQALWFQHTVLVAPRYVGSKFPDQGSNTRPLHWKADT